MKKNQTTEYTQNNIRSIRLASTQNKNVYYLVIQAYVVKNYKDMCGSS